MRRKLLGYLLLLDGAVLFLLGTFLILAPEQVEHAFQFSNLPAAVEYLIGMWGGVFVALGIGYAVAASDPVRHCVWVQMGILRGALECVLGVVYLARGIVTFQQAGVGIILAGCVTLAYVALYPRKPQVTAGPAPL